jgi:hydrogenase maturation factor
MIKTEVVQISKHCEINLIVYSETAKQLTLDYVERSPAHGYSDTETSEELDEKKAQEIIDILQKFIDA